MSENPAIKALDGETEQAWAALVAYCELGPGRTYPKTAEALEHPRSYVSQLQKWGKKWNWKERAGQWDTAELAEQRARRVSLREAGYAPFYARAPENAKIVNQLAKGEPVGTEGKPSVQLQAAIHALAQAGMVPPKRTELVIAEDDGYDAQREAMSSLTLAKLDAILALVEEPEDETG